MRYASLIFIIRSRKRCFVLSITWILVFIFWNSAHISHRCASFCFTTRSSWFRYTCISSYFRICFIHSILWHFMSSEVKVCSACTYHNGFADKVKHGESSLFAFSSYSRKFLSLQTCVMCGTSLPGAAGLVGTSSFKLLICTQFFLA